MRPYCIANSLTNGWQTVSLAVCELWAIAELTEQTHSHLRIGKRKKTERRKGGEGYGKTEFGQDATISVEEEAILRNHMSHVTFDLDLEHTLDARSPGYRRVQVWSQSSHLPTRRSDVRDVTKVPVSRDLWFWPWPWPWAHPGCALTWRPSFASLVAIEPFDHEKKRFANMFTDRQTDGQTDDGRRAIVLSHGMS